MQVTFVGFQAVTSSEVHTSGSLSNYKALSINWNVWATSNIHVYQLGAISFESTKLQTVPVIFSALSNLFFKENTQLLSLELLD